MSEHDSAFAARVRLSCGRHFSCREYGEPGGRPVLALHGTPGSHLKFAGEADAAARVLGLRLIALDRWAYGSSDAPPSPSLATFAADIADLADRLGLARFAVLGISGGGPFAAAAAARLGRRVGAAALVAPVGPVAAITPAPRLDFHHRVAFRVLPRLPGASRLTFGLLRAIAAHAPRLAARIAAGRAGAADRELASDTAFALGLGTTFAAGLATSARGPVIDLELFSRPWGLDLALTEAPTRIWLGSDDRNVPLAAVEALAREIGRGPAEVEVVNLAGQGHFWIARNFPLVLGWIAGQLK